MPYRLYLVGLALVPCLQIYADEANFRKVQKAYAYIGAWFIPILAAVLLLLGARQRWIGSHARHGWGAWVILGGALAFFGWEAWAKLG